MMNIFRGIFGIDFFRNAVVMFTHWPTDDKSERRRKKLGITKEKRVDEINHSVR